MLLLPAALAIASAYVLVSLNAMRAGLLTRFLGILGVIVGALVIIQIGPFPVVQTFWLLALAVLFAGSAARRRPARLADRPRGAVAEPAAAGRGAPPAGGGARRAA